MRKIYTLNGNLAVVPAEVEAQAAQSSSGVQFTQSAKEHLVELVVVHAGRDGLIQPGMRVWVRQEHVHESLRHMTRLPGDDREFALIGQEYIQLYQPGFRVPHKAPQQGGAIPMPRPLGKRAQARLARERAAAFDSAVPDEVKAGLTALGAALLRGEPSQVAGVIDLDRQNVLASDAPLPE